MLPKARPPPTLLFLQDLLCFQHRGGLGSMLRSAGVQVFGADMPMPRWRQLSEKPGILNQNLGFQTLIVFLTLSYWCDAFRKLAKCFLRHFPDSMRARGETTNVDSFGLLSCCLGGQSSSLCPPLGV